MSDTLRYVLIFFAFCGLAACGGEEQSVGREETVGVIPHKVAYEPEETRVEAVGTARARASAIIYPETGGEVTEVLFETGDFVEAGAPLVRLDAREERLAVRLAEVAVKDARQLLSRYRRIEDTGAVSDSQIDEARTALDAAEIELEQAQLSLEQRTVAAPFEGYVGLTDIDPGARITSTTAITQLDDRRVLYVDFAAPEQVFGRVNSGDMVRAVSFADDGKAYEAEIMGVDSKINPTTRSFTIRTKIDNADDALRPGMSFRIHFAIKGNAYPAVPEASIVWGGDGAYVWGISDGKARRIPVTIVARKEGRVLVRGDIPEGSLVIAEGVQKVRDGAPVTFAPLSPDENGETSSAAATRAQGAE